MGSSGTGVDTGQFMMHKGTPTPPPTMVGVGGGSLGIGHFENWGESGMADNSQQTDTSTDVDTDDKNQVSLFHFSPQFNYKYCLFSVKIINGNFGPFALSI